LFYKEKVLQSNPRLDNIRIRRKARQTPEGEHKQMLDLIRKKQKTMILKVVFWAIIATFALTGYMAFGDGESRRGPAGGVAATVNKTQISFDEYQIAYSNLYSLYQSIYREQFTPELEKQLRLRQQALDALIEQTLLLEEAGRLGIKVSQKELVDSIAQIPVFQENGTFSRDLYLQVLSYQRLNAETFENMQRRQLLVDKVREQIQAGVTISEQDVEEEYRNRQEQVNLAFLRFSPASRERRVQIDEAALNAFFQENREQYRTPEQVALSYIVFDPARFQNEVTIAEEDLQRFYRRHLDRFEIAEQVHARHILLAAPGDAPAKERQQKRDLAEKLLAQAREGADFAELARKHSQDPGSAPKGGDLGFFRRGTMVPSFEAAAFALPAGQISDVVESPFGYHLIRVEAVELGGLRPLEEVRAEVEAGVRAEKSRQLAFEKAMDTYNIHRKSNDLGAAAKSVDLKIWETGLFGRHQPAEGLGSQEITSTAFTLAPGELARPVNLSGGTVLFALKERKESRLPELAEVRAEVEGAFRQEQALELAEQDAAKALARLRQGETPAAVARAMAEKSEETGFFARSAGAFVPRIGTSEELARAAFTLTGENPAAPAVYLVDGHYVAAALLQRRAADLNKLDDSLRAELRTDLLDRRMAEAVDRRIQELRDQANIIYAASLQASLEG
jgi:peptidyl-prolyl cis-trans isomerase D